MTSRLCRREMTSHTMLLAVATFWVACANAAFFSRVVAAFPPQGTTLLAIASLAVSLIAVTALLLAPFTLGRAAKPILTVLLLVAAVCAYFMDSFGVAINGDMLRNAAETQWDEALDLVTPKLLAYIVFLGLGPATLLWLLPLKWLGWRKEILHRLVLVAVLSAITGLSITAAGDFFASFLREHKALRAYANPAAPLVAAVRYGKAGLAGAADTTTVQPIASDSHLTANDAGRELILLVVGETARVDRLSINGYARDTTPHLRQEKVLSFTNFWACGSSTAVSVPCMFSALGMEKFDPQVALQQENLLDIAQRAGVNVLWLDNNSSSKGVALRVPYVDYRTPKNNPRCDDECRDVGMLASLQDYIDSRPKGDILIVLHQMGNHGPAYYRRYPPEFEKFRPACHDKDLSRCSSEEIGNAYDNAILYTDHFLGQVIELLKRNDSSFDTALFYVSDHGESLGERGIYLHGLPRVIAPDSQFHVPAILWFGQSNRDVDVPALAKKLQQRFTHDNLFHTILGLLEIETTIYRKELDMLDGAHLPE
ncbi:MAG: phosphoethanolamine--lipid A transferase [Dechloromonas sp.]|jgi:lipid A ethanolaminephosphotransferase|nr:phosphoethanolamine--lipid A transferase [Dechloromonas sp.]